MTYIYSKKGIKSPPTMTYNDEPLEYVQSFKYLGLNFNSKCSFEESSDKLCSQARKAQTVLDLHVMKHPTMSVERALQGRQTGGGVGGSQPPPLNFGWGGVEHLSTPPEFE